MVFITTILTLNSFYAKNFLSEFTEIFQISDYKSSKFYVFTNLNWKNRQRSIE